MLTGLAVAHKGFMGLGVLLSSLILIIESNTNVEMSWSEALHARPAITSGAEVTIWVLDLSHITPPPRTAPATGSIVTVQLIASDATVQHRIIAVV